MVRDHRILLAAGIIGLVVGGVAGIVGGTLVATGRIGPLARYLPTLDRVVPSGATEVIRRERVRIEEESATIDVVRRASPAVVSIVVRKEIPRSPRLRAIPFDDFFDFGVPFPSPLALPEPEPGGKRQVGGGSGFLVTSDGYVLTNRHVVDDSAAEYTVVLSDGRELVAKILARDPFNDLAVLKVDVGGKPLPVLAFGDSSEVQIGQTVIAIGYALSEFRNTVTKGVISGINRRIVAGDSRGGSEVIHEAIQTDAAINPGNSGGPLLNLRGEVIGVNTAVSREGQLIGFAIPVDVAKHVVESVIRDGRIVRPWLGVRYLVVSPSLAKEQQLPADHGALVVRGSTPTDLAIVPGSPAARAGLREGDLITVIDGERIDEDHPLAQRIARKKPGDRVRLTVLREGKERTVEATLGEFKE